MWISLCESWVRAYVHPFTSLGDQIWRRVPSHTAVAVRCASLHLLAWALPWHLWLCLSKHVCMLEGVMSTVCLRTGRCGGVTHQGFQSCAVLQLIVGRVYVAQSRTRSGKLGMQPLLFWLSQSEPCKSMNECMNPVFMLKVPYITYM